MLIIRYKCPECGHKWSDVYECAVDGECPSCQTRNVGPLDWRDENEADARPWWVGVDFALLREQKLTLVELAESARTLGPPPRDAGTIADHVGGIVNLLDRLMDQAAEVVGEKTVFGDLQPEGSNGAGE